jgi:carbonic anhydrase
VRENVKNVVQALRSSAPVLKAKVDSGELKVVGAYYSLDTGSVAFPDEKQTTHESLKR